MKYNKIFFILFFVFTLSNGLSAQNTENNFFEFENEKRNIILSSFEFDPSMSLDLGYGKVFSIMNKNIFVSSSIGTPIFILPDFDHTYLNIDSSIFIFKSNWNVKSKLGFKYKSFDNILSEGSNLGFYLSFTPGYYTKKWFVGFDILYRQYFLTYFSHKEYYTRWFPEAKDGWYYNSAGFFFFSLKGGYNIKDFMELNIKLSYKIANTFETYDPFTIPVAVSVGFDYSF